MPDTQISSEAAIASTLHYRATRKRRASKKAYRERHPARLREEARLRMQKHRAELKKSVENIALAREKRGEADANHRETIRREKFVKKHGYGEYLNLYLPLLNEFNSFRLAGIKIPLSTHQMLPEDQDEDEE